MKIACAFHEDLSPHIRGQIYLARLSLDYGPSTMDDVTFR